MLFYAVNRLALAIAIIVVVIGVLFCMIYVIPGDPVRIALGPLATPEMAASFKTKMGLDQPIWIQFARFFFGILKGDLGTDILSNRGVATSVLEQLPFTLGLIASSMLWSVAIGIPLGCYAAIHRGSMLDRIIGVLSVAVIAVPSFVVAVYALLIFAVQLGWFPAIGAGRRGEPLNQLQHLVLPSVAVGLGWVGYLARMVRASMLEVMGENYIRTARAFGLPERRILFRYALPIAILPTARFLGVGIGNLLNVFNPEVVVVMGGVTLAGDHLFVPLRRETARRAFKPAVAAVRILPSELDTPGVHGAARVFLERGT